MSWIADLENLEPIWLDNPLFTVILIGASNQMEKVSLTIDYLFYQFIWLLFCVAFKRFRLHIIDLDPSSVTTGGWLEDTSLVEKYTISEEDYAKRTGKTFYYLGSVSQKSEVCLSS